MGQFGLFRDTVTLQILPEDKDHLVGAQRRHLGDKKPQHNSLQSNPWSQEQSLDLTLSHSLQGWNGVSAKLVQIYLGVEFSVARLSTQASRGQC